MVHRMSCSLFVVSIDIQLPEFDLALGSSSNGRLVQRRRCEGQNRNGRNPSPAQEHVYGRKFAGISCSTSEVHNHFRNVPAIEEGCNDEPLVVLDEHCITHETQRRKCRE